jgi:uncharacterized protein YggE
VAAIRTEPDEAFVWITLTAVDDSPGTALVNVAERGEALAALLDELKIARSDRATTGITVNEDFDHTPEGRRSLGHRAVSSVSVRSGDTELIGRVIMRAGEELDARLAGPRWSVSASNPARLEAAKQAVVNARAKAKAYAAGVDARLGALLSLSEPDAVFDGHVVGLSARSAGAHPDIHIEAGEQEVVAAIQATFALELA